MRATLATCITALIVIGTATSATAMCGGGAMGSGQTTSTAGKNQCGAMSMGGMTGMPTDQQKSAGGSKAEDDTHAGMDMSGSSKGGMSGMMMGGMKMAGGCCCGGNRAKGQMGGMCGGGRAAMDMQEDHTKDPLLTDPMWDQKPGASPNATPSPPK